MSKAKLRQVAKAQAAAAKPAANLTIQEATLLGISADEKDEKPYVNLKYYWPEHQCFSEWENGELRNFSAFCRKLTSMRWADIYRSGGGSGNKTGLGYTPHKDPSVLPNHPELAQLSPDITWFELRVDGESRVHGFRSKDAFFLVFLDRLHEVYKRR